MIERLHFDDQPLRLPPQNLDAEAAVLGSVLLDREVIGRVSGVVHARDFYRDRNEVIFAAMLALYDRTDPVDYLTLIDELDGTGLLAAAGGTTYVGELLGVVPTPIHAEHYARIVADAGLKRRLISAGGKIAQLGYDRDDPETALLRAEQHLLEVSASRPANNARPMGDLIRAYLDRLEAARDGQAASTAVPTGYGDLDRILKGGLKRGELTILAARPSLGKTSLATGMATHAACRLKAGVAIFSLEMSADQIAERMLAAESGIESDRLDGGPLSTPATLRLGSALGSLTEAAITVDDTGALTPGELRSRVRRMSREVPLDLVIVDHIQLMQGPRGGGANRVAEMTEISRQLKLLAKDEGVAVLALCQLSRAVEQRNPKTPILSDLRESGSIEQDADVVVFIYRDDAYNRDSERPGTADLIVAKHRNGPTGQVSLLFNARTTRFLDLDVERP